MRYLSDNQGSRRRLRPAFEVERRSTDYRYTADTRTETTCRACHSMGRVITERRTREEWGLLVAMHRGYYPGVDNQGFRRGGPPPPDSAGAPHPMDLAITHLARVFPLRTPEWAAWSATMRPRDRGHVDLRGSEPGKAISTAEDHHERGHGVHHARHVSLRELRRERRARRTLSGIHGLPMAGAIV